MKRTMEHPSTAHAPPAKKSPYFIPRAGNPPSPPPGVTAEMCSFDICSKRLTEDDAKKLADHDRSFHRRHAVHVTFSAPSSTRGGAPVVQQQTVERHASGYYICPHRPCTLQVNSSSGGSSSNNNNNDNGPFRCYNKDSFITHCRRTHGLDVQKQYTPIADPPFLSFTSLSSSSSSATAAAVAAAAASSRFNSGSVEDGGGGVPPLLSTGSATDGLLLQLLISMDDIKTAINNQSKIITKAINKQSAAITAAINEQTEVLKEHTAAINNHTAAINDQYE